MRRVSRPSSRSLETHLQSLPPEEAIPYLLKSLHHSLRQAVDEGLRRERIDMSFAHLATLYTIDAEPGLAGAELARRSSVTAQTMNTILRRLERDGQLERRPHPSSSARRQLVRHQGAAASSWIRRRSSARRSGARCWRRSPSAKSAQLQNLLQRCIRGLDAQVERSAAGKAGRTRASAKKKTASASRQLTRPRKSALPISTPL